MMMVAGATNPHPVSEESSPWRRRARRDRDASVDAPGRPSVGAMLSAIGGGYFFVRAASAAVAAFSSAAFGSPSPCRTDEIALPIATERPA